MADFNFEAERNRIFEGIKMNGLREVEDIVLCASLAVLNVMDEQPESKKNYIKYADVLDVARKNLRIVRVMKGLE